ncbi:hypothetical protein PHLGIDRAFT_15495 [Phlebiopsis gigantea 11061_1 CR5-6]|uniref:Uncharacterized protein n=1 Tax=Phlebiopsis gigantea (strain 11061_1 CR5-6) TaxID=745531 RepID=A0A0C3NGS9_PHLG1|nr:hypothetical protein PHLGIDRAFT_15495 [Phlebiopsis gigantea 11061_1 CR5-6]
MYAVHPKARDPHIANISIDDLSIKGLADTMNDTTGNSVVLENNPGQKCIPEGHLLDIQKVEKILNWPALRILDIYYHRKMSSDPKLELYGLFRALQACQLHILVHVPAEKHKGPDALLHCELGENEFIDTEDQKEWVDNIALYTHFIQKTYSISDTADERTLYYLQQDYDLFDTPIVLASPISKQDQTLIDIYNYLNKLQVSTLPEGPTH